MLCHLAIIIEAQICCSVSGGSFIDRCDASTLRVPCSLSIAEQEILTLFRRLTTSVSPLAPPPPHPGILSKWFLDFGASFHMTHPTHLSLFSFPHSSSALHTADGMSLPVVGRGTLTTSSFHVPTVSHVPQVAMQLMSAG